MSLSFTTFTYFVNSEETDVYEYLGLGKPSCLFRTQTENLENSIDEIQKKDKIDKEIEKVKKQKKDLVEQLKNYNFD